MPARRIPSWAWVTGLTAGAVAAVGFLAVEASHGAHPRAVPRAAAPAPARPSAEPSPPAPPAVPAASGTGRRIVYSLGAHRVWLVDASDTARRTFTVWPGSVSPDPGTYAVSRRLDATTGSDGVRIEHILYFTAKSGVYIAFSNAVDGASPPPAAPGTRTGGIRLHKADGTALWTFGTAGTRVVVVR
ncbi:L,D-transpeptidase [Streptomyces echinoruber]|uniref:L,D-transpeptidase n=1 Tax=Streptomyces echinoruber TaxID=68898 RepID=A0A918VL69_9ACTN|nr:L,D-transpeptidase [Streptomyces echinoruber]